MRGEVEAFHRFGGRTGMGWACGGQDRGRNNGYMDGDAGND
jgi:hypothetical protein